MEQPLISVIVPVYNVKAYLACCANSVLGQTLAAFELILVDDGSTDGSGAICDAYKEKDSRVRVIHQENGGLSAARNAGIEVAAGAYLTFIDSDDYVARGYLETLYTTAQSENADIVIGAYQKVDIQGRPLEEKSRPAAAGPVSGPDVLPLLFGPQGTYYIVSCGKLYRHGLFETLRFPPGKLHEDEMVAHRLYAGAGTVVCLCDVLLFYRTNDEGITRAAFSARRFDANDAYYNRYLFIRGRAGDGVLAETAFEAYFLRFLQHAPLAVKHKPDGWKERLQVEKQRLRETKPYVRGYASICAGDKRLLALGAVSPLLAALYTGAIVRRRQKK